MNQCKESKKCKCVAIVSKKNMDLVMEHMMPFLVGKAVELDVHDAEIAAFDERVKHNRLLMLCNTPSSQYAV